MDSGRNPPVSFGLTPAAEMAAMSGIDFPRGMFADELPHATMMQQGGFTCGSAEPGLVGFARFPGRSITIRPAAPWRIDRDAAVQSMLPARTIYTTLEFKISLLRAITTESGEVRAEGRALNAGRRVGTAEGVCAMRATACAPTAPPPAS